MELRFKCSRTRHKQGGVMRNTAEFLGQEDSENDNDDDDDNTIQFMSNVLF